MKLLVKADDGGAPAATHTLDCPLCASVAPPPPAVQRRDRPAAARPPAANRFRPRGWPRAPPPRCRHAGHHCAPDRLTRSAAGLAPAAAPVHLQERRVQHKTRLAWALALAPFTLSAQEAPTRSLGVMNVEVGQPTSLPTQIPTTMEGIDRRQIEHSINATDSQDALMYGPFSAAYPGNAAGAVVDYVTRMPTRFAGACQGRHTWCSRSSCTAPTPPTAAGRPALRSATGSATGPGGSTPTAPTAPASR